MVLETIRNLVSDKEPTPNKFTIAMGELIHKARDESGLSQADLAKKIYRRRATISDIENGKVEVSSGTLTLLAAALAKPITYFYPPFLYKELEPEKLAPLEQELLTHFRNIWDEYLQKVAVEQVKVLSVFDPEEMLLDSIERISIRLEQNEAIKAILENKNKHK